MAPAATTGSGAFTYERQRRRRVECCVFPATPHADVRSNECCQDECSEDGELDKHPARAEYRC
jgi:hypothetical protein